MIVDILMNVDMKGVAMPSWLRKPRELVVEFCDRCAQVCDAACRAEAVRESTEMQVLRFGVRI